MTQLKLQNLQKGDITQQHIDILGDVLVGNHLFVIFAALDVSIAVNWCLNHSFFTFTFYYISVAVTWYGVRGTEYVIPTIFEVLPYFFTFISNIDALIYKCSQMNSVNVVDSF